MIENLKDMIKNSDCVLIGIGKELSKESLLKNINEQNLYSNDKIEVYQALYNLIKEKRYFIITSNTDDLIYKSDLDFNKIVAPCGSDFRLQCENACCDELYNIDEVINFICPHCGAKLIKNVRNKENKDKYVETGYLNQWNEYKKWLTYTLNKNILVLELGENFDNPNLIRWAFERIVYYNNKAKFIRVNERFYQVQKEIEEKSIVVKQSAKDFLEEYK